MDGHRAAATLGVGRHASHDELRRAFRARAKDLHPDAGPRGSASDFIALRRAFELLMAGPPEPTPVERSRVGVSGPWVDRVTLDASVGRGAAIDLADAARRPRPGTGRSGVGLAVEAPRDARGLTFQDHLVAELTRR